MIKFAIFGTFLVIFFMSSVVSAATWRYSQIYQQQICKKQKPAALHTISSAVAVYCVLVILVALAIPSAE